MEKRFPGRETKATDNWPDKGAERKKDGVAVFFLLGQFACFSEAAGCADLDAGHGRGITGGFGIGQFRPVVQVMPDTCLWPKPVWAIGA